MFTKFASFRVAALVVIVLCFTAAVIFKSGSASKANNYPAAFVPVIGATKSVAVVVGNADADADPGETLEYTVTINNTGPDPATGVTINDTIQNITTLVAGSTIASPVAVNDTFSSIGNVGISVPDGASDLLANDLDREQSGLGAALFKFFNQAVTQGGQVAINNDNRNVLLTSAESDFEGSTRLHTRSPTAQA